MVRQNGTNTLLTRIFHAVFAHRVPQINDRQSQISALIFPKVPPWNSINQINIGIERIDELKDK